MKGDNMIIKDIVIKSEWQDKDGKIKKKYHNAGVLFINEKGEMYGSLNIFGQNIKFNLYDKKPKEEKDEVPF